MLERELRESIRAAAKDCGYLVYFSWTSIHSPRGFPDLFICHSDRGIAFAWELKSEKGTVKPAQQEWLDALAQVPGIDARVIRPADLENAYKALISGHWPKDSV